MAMRGPLRSAMRARTYSDRSVNEGVPTAHEKFGRTARTFGR